MKLAIIGSRGLTIDNIGEYLPNGVSEIVSGGASGVDRCAAEYARKNGIVLKEFLPEYSRYRRAAPLKRNEQIAEYSDCALVFWDGSSKGSLYAIKCFERLGKNVKIILIDNK